MSDAIGGKTAREIHEYDATGTLSATYIISRVRTDSRNEEPAEKRDDERMQMQERVDVVLPKKSERKSLATQAFEAFLPAGYPGSVGDDYLRYQIFDSLQAFASSIAGLLSSRAVLEGVGVGNASATPQSALFLSIVQETLSRIATIFFAHRFGTVIEPECKMYRLLADVFNDIAMVLDCTSPLFPGPMRVGVLAAASVLRALCGVAAGSAKGCLSAHFARKGNLGEVAAKDASQETVISLAGMLVGTFVVSQITSHSATWSALILLLTIHLLLNYAAVRAVRMRTLNRQRATIVFAHLIESGKVLTPEQVSAEERIFERDGVLRSHNGTRLGYCRIGASMQECAGAVGRQRKASGSYITSDMLITDILQLYSDERYLLSFDAKARIATVSLRQDASSTDQLRAWLNAMVLSMSNDPTHLALHRSALRRMAGLFDRHSDDLTAAGWDLDTSTLETKPSPRLSTG